MFELVPVQSGPRLEDIRALFYEYAASLEFNLCFQGIEKEFNELPGPYSIPHGRLFLALEDGMSAGCIGLKRIEPGICEMKRLYVCPNFRGRQLGRMLVDRLVQEAAIAGYVSMRLDTIARLMPEAMRLYRSFGFREIPPYYENPIAGATYMELDLRK